MEGIGCPPRFSSLARHRGRRARQGRIDIHCRSDRYVARLRASRRSASTISIRSTSAVRVAMVSWTSSETARRRVSAVTREASAASRAFSAACRSSSCCCRRASAAFWRCSIASSSCSCRRIRVAAIHSRLLQLRAMCAIERTLRDTGGADSASASRSRRRGRVRASYDVRRDVVMSSVQSTRQCNRVHGRHVEGP